MKFLVGFAAGVAVGAVGAVVYSMQTGRDLRVAFEDVRSELQRRDTDALSQRLEAGFAQIQAQLDERLAQVREKTAAAGQQAASAAAETAADAAEAAGDAAEAAGEVVEDAVQAAADEGAAKG